MFENLTDKFERAFKVLKGQGQITEINVAETLKEVRRALLDADVSFNTAKQFTKTVKEKALGKDVLNAVSPGQLMIKICHEGRCPVCSGARTTGLFLEFLQTLWLQVFNKYRYKLYGQINDRHRNPRKHSNRRLVAWCFHESEH